MIGATVMVAGEDRVCYYSSHGLEVSETLRPG